MALTGQEIIHNLALGLVGEFQVQDTADSRALKQNLLCIRYYPSARDLSLRSHPWNEAKKRALIAQVSDEPVFGYDKRYAEPTDSLRVLSVNDIIGSDVRNRAGGIKAWEVEDGEIYSNAGEIPQVWATNTKYVDGEFVSSTAVVWTTSTSYIADQFVKDSGLVYQVLIDHTSTTIAADITSNDLQAGVKGSTGTYEILVSHISDTLLTDVASANIRATGSESRVIFVEYIYQLTDTTKFSINLEEVISVQLAIKILPGIKNDPKGKEELINEFERLVMPHARSIDGSEGTPKRYSNSSWLLARSQGTRGGY